MSRGTCKRGGDNRTYQGDVASLPCLADKTKPFLTAVFVRPILIPQTGCLATGDREAIPDNNLPACDRPGPTVDCLPARSLPHNEIRQSAVHRPSTVYQFHLTFDPTSQGSLFPAPDIGLHPFLLFGATRLPCPDSRRGPAFPYLYLYLYGIIGIGGWSFLGGAPFVCRRQVACFSARNK